MPSEDARLGAALRELLRASFGLVPDDVPAAVRDVAMRHLGARDIVLLLVDLDQTELRHFETGPTQRPPSSIDGSAAGEAFREERPVEEHLPEGRWLWVPVLDSAERLGVLGILDDGGVSPATWADYASLIGELVMGKEPYGDAMALIRRSGELTVAAEMRWSLLPPLTFTSPLVGISGILQPSRLIAGDAFDYAVTSTRADVGIFDAMGHGLEASRMANLAIGGYRNARRGGKDLGAVLSTIDGYIESEFGEARFVTAQIARLDLESGLLRIAGAGHPPPTLLRVDEAPSTIPTPPCRPLGLGYGPCDETTVQLSPGDAVLFHTDGVSEARSPSGDVYGEATMARAVDSLLQAGVRPPEALRRVIHDVLRFQGDRVRDDASLVLLRWRPDVDRLTPPPDIPATLPT